MKRIFTLLIFLIICSLHTFAQVVPPGMKYQAVARNLDGQILANQDISLQVALVTYGKETNYQYLEEHHTTTNKLGLFTLTIGKGQVNKGAFDEIPWSTDQIWMELSIDERGGNDYTLIHSSKLLAVPYAFHAATADEVSGEGDSKGASKPWTVDGNLGTSPDEHFIGTVDPKDLVFKTAWEERMRITGDEGIVIMPLAQIDHAQISDLNAGELNVNGDTEIGGKLEVFGWGNFKDILQVEGHMDALQTLHVGTDLDVNKDAVIGNDLDVGNDTRIVRDLDVGNDTRIVNDLDVGNDTRIVHDLDVGNDTRIVHDLDVGNNVSIENDLDVNGNSTFNALTVEGEVDLNTISGATTIGGATTINNTTGLNGQVTINAPITGGADSDYAQYPLRVEGGDHGIAVKINGTIPHRDRNYVTFFDGGGTARGRIEGFDFSEDNISIARSILEAALPVPGLPNPVTGSGFPSFDVDDPADGVPNAIQNIFNSFNSDYGVGIVSGTLDLVNTIIQGIINIAGCVVITGCDDLVAAVIDVIHSGIQLSLHIFYFGFNEGVAFESGGADYAEWLEKAYATEMITYGEVVGVKGGLISKDFTEAEKFMAISVSPTVIGAMPDVEKAHLYEKIAFMGQVPVRVIGEVKKGDYILPTGNGDGMAIAVHPDNMKAKDYSRIVGIAWGESDGKKIYEYVNTAVGINSNDMAGVVEQMQIVMNQLQIAMEQVNPDYQAHYYDVDGTVHLDVPGYTTAPTMNEVINQKLDVAAYSSTKEKIETLRQQGLQQGFDLNKYPYLSDIIQHPENKQVREEALAYYQAASVRLQNMLIEIQQRN